MVLRHSFATLWSFDCLDSAGDKFAALLDQNYPVAEYLDCCVRRYLHMRNIRPHFRYHQIPSNVIIIYCTCKLS